MPRMSNLVARISTTGTEDTPKQRKAVVLMLHHYRPVALS
jgi:hypothetical protein